MARPYGVAAPRAPTYGGVVTLSDPRHGDLTFGTLDPSATDEESLRRLTAYGDAWSTAFLEGRLDEEKRKHWLAHSRADDVTFRFAEPTRTTVGTLLPVATFSSWDQEMNVGGPDLLPLRMITDVTVAPTHRRRGLLTRLMTEDLDDAASRGVPLAALTVSEGSIYGRYGFGPATRFRRVEADVRPGRFALRTEGDGDGGSLERLEPQHAYPVLQQMYAAHLRQTRGEVARPAFYEPVLTGVFSWTTGGPDRALEVVVHLDGAGHPDGYVAYRAKETDGEASIEVADLVALTPAAYLRLWRFLADVDLVSTVKARVLLDDVLDHALVDLRAARTTEVRDFLWLRILDLPVALEGRPWRDDASVVLEVDDPQGHVAGRWRVTTEGGRARVERTDDAAGVRLSAETLATLYLGDRLVPALAAAGRVSGPDVDAFAAMADHAGPPPACRTGF
jgi:predicted acetyltransferase